MPLTKQWLTEEYWQYRAIGISLFCGGFCYINDDDVRIEVWLVNKCAVNFLIYAAAELSQLNNFT